MRHKTIGMFSLLALAALGLVLAGCGVKGPLEPPAGVVNKSAPPDQSKTEPHRPFILDGLLE